MAAPIGNKFWRMRTAHGRPRIFDSPQELWDACVGYFDWAEENPLYEAKAFSTKDGIVVEALPKVRAMTLVGLTNFLDIGLKTWQDYRNREEYGDVCERVERVIYQQKFEYAAADMMNVALIARDLGLADKRELSGPNGGPIETSDATAILKAKIDAIAGRISGEASED